MATDPALVLNDTSARHHQNSAYCSDSAEQHSKLWWFLTEVSNVTPSASLIAATAVSTSPETSMTATSTNTATATTSVQYLGQRRRQRRKGQRKPTLRDGTDPINRAGRLFTTEACRNTPDALATLSLNGCIRRHVKLIEAWRALIVRRKTLTARPRKLSYPKATKATRVVQSSKIGSPLWFSVGRMFRRILDGSKT